MQILFLCSSNIFRSQIAEAFFNFYSRKNTAGSAALVKPQDKMHALVVRTMKEEGIDISDKTSKMVSKEIIENVDVIIFMNSNLKEHLESIKPYLKENAKIQFWEIPDIVAKETDEHLYPEFVKTRNIIKEKVKELVGRIG